MLAVDQDPLGKEATTIARDGDTCVYAKDLADGSKAGGLFNLGETETTVQVKWSDLGLKGRLHVRTSGAKRTWAVLKILSKQPYRATGWR